MGRRTEIQLALLVAGCSSGATGSERTCPGCSTRASASSPSQRSLRFVKKRQRPPED